MVASDVDGSFKPALLVVDMQEDFCPPEGSLAVAGGRDIAPTINRLLSMPFALKIATRDFHPRDHVSFETAHPSPDIKAFESSFKIVNPSNTSESREIPIWPDHCVQGTKGANIIPEIDVSKFDEIVEKGKDSRLEMFSGFADIFGSKSSDAASMDLAGHLKSTGITHVYTVGIAGDFCVKCTALDAKKEGFEVYVIEEATRSVDPGEKGWGAAKEEMSQAGVKTISINGTEIDRIRKLS
ncbi:nicotinamidase/pyrazinamidase, partial [Lecanoromycetidae sp. Uapishka_2]